MRNFDPIQTGSEKLTTYSSRTRGLNFDVRFSLHVDDSEGNVLHVSLHFEILRLGSDQTLDVGYAADTVL